ncbi:IPT/TIG domain-containing protein [Actinoplanes sp. NPDC049596]|uniref:IPT/TIG domain-containing protein n=1 Tax=unclassified Actinoplanes TaxID=2626549 RepID=UPI0034137956
MRKSQSTRGFRPLKAGVAVAGCTAAVLAGMSAPAFAANTTVVVDPLTAPIGGGTTVTVTGTDAFPSATATVLAGRITTATCPTTYGTTGLAVAVSRTDKDTAEVTLTAGTIPAGTYKVCVYGVASGSTVVSASPIVANGTGLVVSAASTKPTLSNAAGPVAGGNTFTATGAGNYLASATTVGATFSTGDTCPATYTTTGGNTAATTVVKTSASVATITAPAGLTAGSSYKVCLYGGTAANSALLGTAASTYSVLPASSISPSAGGSGLTNTIIISQSALTFPSAPGVIFTSDACPATYTTGATAFAADTISRISGTRLAAKMTADVAMIDSKTTKYNVCVYSNTTDGALILAPATYTVAAPLTVGAVSPTSGPSQGGTRITLAGTGFPSPYDPAKDTLSVSIGGSPLKDIVVNSSTELVGTTTAHTAGSSAVKVTTESGSANSTNSFAYTFGITVTPNTAKQYVAVTNAVNPTLDIVGTGIGNLTYGATVNNSSQPVDVTTGGTSYIFLVDNSWFTTVTGLTTGDARGAGLISQCASPVKIDDDEVICTLMLNNIFDSAASPAYSLLKASATVVPKGSYQLVVVNDTKPVSNTAWVAGTNFSKISSGSVFTVSDF